MTAYRWAAVAGAALVALVAAIVIIVITATGTPAPPGVSAEQQFRTYMAGHGRPAAVVDAATAASKSWCGRLDYYGGDVDTVIHILNPNGTPTGEMLAVTIEVFTGMGRYVCPQYADAINRWVASQ